MTISSFHWRAGTLGHCVFIQLYVVSSFDVSCSVRDLILVRLLHLLYHTQRRKLLCSRSTLYDLEAEGKLPLRVYALLEAREPELIDEWLQKGPDRDSKSMLVTRSVKAFYDAALGSRGARLLEDYADRPRWTDKLRRSQNRPYL